MGGRTRPELLAAALAGSWRAEPPEAALTRGELERITPLLVGSGAAALAWRKVSRTELRWSAPACALRRAYHAQTLQSALQEWEIEHVFALLRSAGVEPILLKGRAAACLYTEPGLRPPGDIDICVSPARYGRAQAALRGPGRRGTALVDLTHDDDALYCAGGWEGLYARSVLVRLNETEVRALGREDLLRFLCLHLLRHSAYRPLWLCDIAAALEAAPPDFDWRVALGDTAVRRNWVACALHLAHTLLGAAREDLPAAAAARAPLWLAPEVLRQWERPRTVDRLPRELMAVSLRSPRRALPALLSRWPDPIRAHFRLGLPFDDRPRLPRQLASYLLQSAAFLKKTFGGGA